MTYSAKKQAAGRTCRGASFQKMVLATVVAGVVAAVAAGGFIYYRANSATQLAARARLALEQHDSTHAIDYLQRALKGHSTGETGMGLRNLMARALIDAGREADARNYLQQVLAEKPDNAEARELLADSYVNPPLRKLREAIKPVSEAGAQEVYKAIGDGLDELAKMPAGSNNLLAQAKLHRLQYLVLADQERQATAELDAAQIAQNTPNVEQAKKQIDAIKGPEADHRQQALAKLQGALAADPANGTAAALIAQYEYNDHHYAQAVDVYEKNKGGKALTEDLVLSAARAIIDDDARPDHAARLTQAQGLLEGFLKDHPKSPRTMVSLGDVLLEQGKVGDAAKLGEQAAMQAPGDLAAQVLLVNCKLREKKTDDALRLITPLTTTHANQPEVWYLLGMAQMDAGSAKDAEDAFRKALAVNPGYGPARQALLAQELKSGNTAGAALVASDVLRDDRYNMTAWGVVINGMRSRGQMDRARDLLISLSNDPQAPMDARRELVRLLSLYNDPADANRLLGTLPPNDKETLTLRAYIAGAGGNSGESRALIAQAIKGDPGDLDLRLKYAELLLQANLAADARTQLDQVMAAGQDAKSGAHLTADQSLQLARGYLLLRLPAQAQQALKPVLDKQPQPMEAAALAGQAQAMLGGVAGSEGTTAADANLQNASLADIERAATTALQQKKYQPALVAARAGLARDKSDSQLHRIAALALAGLGQPEQAVEEVVEAARSQPDAFAAYGTFVDMFDTPDAAMKGIGYGSRMESVNPALGNWAMGRLAQAAGDYELALRYYQKGVEVSSRIADSRDAKNALYQGLLSVPAQRKDAAGLAKAADQLAGKDEAFAPGIRLMAVDELLALADRQAAQRQLEEVSSHLTPASRVPLVLAAASRWLSLGQADRARALMEKQLASNGQQPEFLDAYASLLTQAKEYDKALEVRNTLCKLDAANPVYRVSLAQAQSFTGDMPAAFRTLDDARALGATGQEMADAARRRLLIAMGLLNQATQELTAHSTAAGGADDPASRLAVAQAWAQLQKPDEARKMADAIPPYAAEYPAARMLVAGLDLDAGKNQPAIAALTDLIAKTPAAAPQASPQLFIAYLRAGDAPAALELATRQRAGYITNSPIWQTWTTYAATAAREGGSYEQAIALLDSLDADSRKAAMLDIALMQLLSHKPAEAMKAAAQVPDNGPAHFRTTLALLAGATGDAMQTRALFADGLPSTVIAALAALPADQRSAQLAALAGNPHLFRGDLETLLQETGKLPADTATAQLRQVALAQKLLEAGWSTTALQVLADVEKTAPGLTMAAIERHQALTDLHRFTEADALRDQLIQRAKANPSIAPSMRILLAAAWAKQEKYAEALAVLQPLAALQQTDILTTLATLHEKLGQLDEAIALHRQVRKIDPENIAAANNLAYTLSAAHPTDKAAMEEARKAIEFAIQKAPQITALQDTLGWIQIQSGNPTEGTRNIARALSSLRLDPAVHYHLGVGYARMGQTALARMHLMNVGQLAHDKQNVPELQLATEALRTLATAQ